MGLGIVLVSAGGACFGLTVLLRCHCDRAKGGRPGLESKLLRMVLTNGLLRVFKTGLAKYMPIDQSFTCS
jgi:hypothetical protein